MSANETIPPSPESQATPAPRGPLAGALDEGVGDGLGWLRLLVLDHEEAAFKFAGGERPDPALYEAVRERRRAVLAAVAERIPPTPTRDSGGDSGAGAFESSTAHEFLVKLAMRAVYERAGLAGTHTRETAEKVVAESLRRIGGPSVFAEWMQRATPAPAASAPAGGALGDVLRRAAEQCEDGCRDSAYKHRHAQLAANAATLRALAADAHTARRVCASAAIWAERQGWHTRRSWATAIPSSPDSARRHADAMDDAVAFDALAALLRRLAGEGAR